MPRIFKIGAFWVYFWANENRPLEPIHVHVSKGAPRENATKIWITESGKCLVNGKNEDPEITEKELKTIIRVIEANSAEIIQKWYDFFGEIKFYC